MAEVKWIKIVTDIFDDEKILLIESLPDKYAIICCWFKLLCLAGKQNNGGVFMMNERIPYTEEMLSVIFRMPINTIRLSLETFRQYGMIEIIDGVITIPNWEKHQTLDKIEKTKEQTRKRVAAHRERQKQLVTGCNVTDSVTVTQCNADRIRIEEDIEEEIEEDIEKNYIADLKSAERQKSKPTRHKYGEYNNVLLSDEDFEKLKAEFPSDYEERIERLSSYMASTGKSYKNHLATIRNWARKEESKNQQSGQFVSKHTKPAESGNVFLRMLKEGE